MQVRYQTAPTARGVLLYQPLLSSGLVRRRGRPVKTCSEAGNDARLAGGRRHFLVLCEKNVHGRVRVGFGVMVSRRDLVITAEIRQAASARIVQIDITMTLNHVTNGQFLDVKRQRVVMNSIFLENAREHSEIKIWVCTDEMGTFVVQS